MGLDQYMFRKVGEESTEVAYWRKCNQIHNWFIEHCAGGDHSINCEDIEVNLEQLAGLRQTCQEVIDDPSKAAELLPTRSGFFFGSTGYDEWYINGLKETVGIIDRILSEAPAHPQARYVYYVWW